VSVEICDLFEDNINDALYVCTSDELRDCRHDSVYPASCYTYFPTKRNYVLYIHCIFVKRDFHGKGIGLKLLLPSRYILHATK
jgi:GNAT superfamily N-acetyltransferase